MTCPRVFRVSTSTAQQSVIMAQPVSRDGFFYDGLRFWVEVDGNQHVREPPKTLRPLLTGEAPSGSAAQKDKPTHFYVAQLKHYGLKPLKTKGPAKAALLEALNQKPKLSVPPHISEIERSLRVGFSCISGGSGEREPPSKKRKMDEVSGRPTVTKATPVAPPSHSNPTAAKPLPAARITKSQKELVDRVVDLPRLHLHKLFVDLIKQNPGLEEKIREKVANKRVKAGPSTTNDKVSPVSN